MTDVKPVALITGSGRGIGREIAARLAADGFAIMLSDVNAETLEATKQAFAAAGRTVAATVANVADAADAERLVTETMTAFGRVDALVNNAGITRDGLVLRMKDEQWDAVLNVNLRGTFLMSRAALKPMLKQKGGTIINIASVIGLMGNAGQANYAASKAGIIGLSRSLAKEYGSKGIRVNAIAPGFIKSEMTDALSPETREALLKQIPLGFLGEPADVADLVSFLASSRSRYITGQVLQVDGGMVMA